MLQLIHLLKGLVRCSWSTCLQAGQHCEGAAGSSTEVLHYFCNRLYRNRMEEDNAHDIFKWFITLSGSKKAIISVTFREETFNAELILYGNMLSCASTEDAKVPLIFVIEGATVQKLDSEESPFACGVTFPDSNDNLILRFDSEKMRESWMIKMATCSHQMARAQLDEIAYKFYTMGTKHDSGTDCSYSTAHSFYLTNPYKQNNLPSRRVAFEEIMSESKLSIVLPVELVKLYKKWIIEFSCLLESRQHQWPLFAIPYLYDVLREIRANTETLEQCSEFLENYSVSKGSSCPFVTDLLINASLSHEVMTLLGPSFDQPRKDSLLRLRSSDNLHVHQSTVDNRVTREVLSCGTTSALPLRFQVFERFKDIADSIAELDEYAEILADEENRRVSLGQNMDTIDAMVISLTTKVAVMDKINEEQGKSEIYEKTVREAICLCFDMLLALADSVLESQLFGLVVETHKSSTSHLYFHVQLRSDFILSQAITIAATAVLNTVYRGWPIADGSLWKII
ncbi:hypothetical protein OSTOST_18056 [Ostertagia ostertagi]